MSSVILRIAAGFILVIVALTMFPVIDSITSDVFVTLDASTNILYVSLIKLICGLVPFLIMVSGIWDIVGPKPTVPGY